MSKKEIENELGEAPNDKYKKFFEKFKEAETLEIDKWRVVHILSYFCKKYQAAYNIKYQFKFNSPKPTSCFEVFQIKKLAMLLSSKPAILRDYIDWVFKVKVEKSKRRLTSISFMTHEDLVNYYKLNVLLADNKSLQIDRSTPLTTEIKEIMKTVGSIETYGDLSFMWQIQKADSLGLLADEAFAKLTEINFDLSVLDRIV